MENRAKRNRGQKVRVRRVESWNRQEIKQKKKRLHEDWKE